LNAQGVRRQTLNVPFALRRGIHHEFTPGCKGEEL
jgi:hypothetical protein